MFAIPIAAGAELRPLEVWQAAEFAAHVRQARPNIGAYIPWGDQIVDEESARLFLERYAQGQARDERYLAGIWLDGKLVGGVLFRVFDAAAGYAELGVWLTKEAEGRGLITRSSQLMIDWAIRDRGLRRIEWRCVPANTRSVAVAQRLGMTLEGTLRQVFAHRGEVHDIQIWSLLREEWEQRTWQEIPSRS